LPPGQDFRINLITVPSCDKHNNEKSGDDQYLLQLIVSYYGNNLAAQRHFCTHILRALKKDPSLHGVFADPRPVDINGRPTMAFSVDRRRFDRSIDRIARALYFERYNGEKWTGRIRIDSPALIQVGGYTAQKANRFIPQHNSMTAVMLDFEPRLGDNPEIFYYKIHRDKPSRRIMVRMVFYKGFIVTAHNLYYQ
jgi:hypothetical protein